MTEPVHLESLKPPTDWDAVYAAQPDTYHFGEEPSQVARAALRWHQHFGGNMENAQALDLGSGEGRDTVFLAQAGLHVTARDLSPTGIEKTRRLMARNSVPAERVDAAVQDVQGYAYPPAAYDLALAANVYQFLPPADVPAHIENLKRAVKPGGICAVGVFSPAMIAWGAQLTGHFTATADELLAFFGEGWMLLDRTDYWTYRPERSAMGSFVYVVARREPEKE